LNSVYFGWMFWVVYKFFWGYANEGWDMIPYDPNGTKYSLSSHHEY